MASRRHALNPSKVKADLGALETNPPPEIFQQRLELRRRMSVVVFSLLSAVLLTASFVPFDCWYLAYVAMVPWGMALAGATARRWALLWAWLAGVLFWAVNLYWLWWITLVGYFALFIYLSAYWLVAALVLRAAMRRNWPIWIVLPVVWVSLEYLRAYVLSGFTWFYLAHTQYSRTWLIQIADVTGEYGVSFFVAMVNGAIIDLMISPLFAWTKGQKAVRLRKLNFAGIPAVAVVAAALLGYGCWRVGQKTTSPGPVIGVVQQAYPIALGKKSEAEDRILQSHLDASEAFYGKGCDLVIWPETMLPPGLNVEVVGGDPSNMSEGALKAREYAQQVAQMSWRLQCPILAGGLTIHLNPDPLDENDRILVKNSALWFDRTWKAGPVYSKVHPVPFSEYVPLKRSCLWLHRVLRWFVPEEMTQLEPGDRLVVFELAAHRDAGRPGATWAATATAPEAKRKWTLVTPICYEGIFARLCRQMVNQDGPKADILVNLSNDGWFYWQWARHRSLEYPQHLVQYCFRAVENRVPVVRAVNTGISASIDSNGRIVAEVRDPQKKTRHRAMVAGALLLDGAMKDGAEFLPGHGPKLLVDNRITLYSRVGDAFAMLDSAAAIVLTVMLGRKKGHRPDKRTSR